MRGNRVAVRVIGWILALILLTGLVRDSFARRLEPAAPPVQSSYASRLVFLLFNVLTVDTTQRDLLGSLGSSQATITNVQQYEQFILILNKRGAAPVTIRVLARATDPSGQAFHDFTPIAQMTFDAPANATQRFTFGQAGWDEYRIELTSTASQEVRVSLKGIRL